MSSSPSRREARGFVLGIARAWGLLWRAAPRLFATNLVLSIVQSALPLAALYLLKLIVDAIAAAAIGVNTAAPTSVYVLIAIGRARPGELAFASQGQGTLSHLEQEMLKRIQDDASASGYGMQIKFLGIKRLGFPESVTETVFKRMQSERELQEKAINAEAENAASVIRSGANLQSAKILAEADAQATRIRGMGEMEAAKSFEVFQRNPELAKFLLDLNGLELFLKDRTTLILDEGTPPLTLLKPQANPPKKQQ